MSLSHDNRGKESSETEESHNIGLGMQKGQAVEKILKNERSQVDWVFKLVDRHLSP